MNAPELPAVEWDFRSIHRVAFPQACLWEYARESAAIKAAVKKWVATKIDGKSIHAHLDAPRAINALCLSNPSTAAAIQESAFKVFEPEFAALLLELPRFPAPWQSLSLRVNESFNDTGLKPVSPAHFVKMFGVFQNGQHPVFQKKYCAFTIKPEGATLQMIRDQFNEFLLEWAKSRPELSKGTKGATPKYHLLKALAALRLSRFGLNHDTARTYVATHKQAGQFHNFVQLPEYGSGGAWHDAKKEAEAEIKAVEKRILPSPPPVRRSSPKV